MTVVDGPNQRTDFHDALDEEFFDQFKGNAYLNIFTNGKAEPVELQESAVRPGNGKRQRLTGCGFE